MFQLIQLESHQFFTNSATKRQNQSVERCQHEIITKLLIIVYMHSRNDDSSPLTIISWFK